MIKMFCIWVHFADNPFSVSSLSCCVEPWVCGWTVLSAELFGGGDAELPIPKPLPLQPGWRDGDVLHPSKQEASHSFTERHRSSTHAAFDAHTQTRPAGAQRHPHPAPQHQVTSERLADTLPLKSKSGDQKCFLLVWCFSCLVFMCSATETALCVISNHNRCILMNRKLITPYRAIPLA